MDIQEDVQLSSDSADVYESIELEFDESYQAWNHLMFVRDVAPYQHQGSAVGKETKHVCIKPLQGDNLSLKQRHSRVSPEVKVGVARKLSDLSNQQLFRPW